jgi:sarcosine oxidase, subunit gamma
MSDPISALNGASFEGFATIREIGPIGMITLRAKAGTKGLDKAILAATGCAVPALLRMETKDDRAAGWMSPDEVLLILPYAEVSNALDAIAQALKGQHHLAVNVSDARAVFRVEGAQADQVMRKISPVDFDTLALGELRRSRAAQVAAAFWRDETGFTVVCFRSVAGYMMALLSQSAKAGSEL